PPYLYQPLWQSIRTLVRSRPLSLAVVGIAFFTFIVAFMRITMYMHGQTRVPQWDEAKTSEVVGMVALGIGLGSPLVGFLSGGLRCASGGCRPGGTLVLLAVPLRPLRSLAALLLSPFVPHLLQAFLVCLPFLGFFTRFYNVALVPLLHHRAPKTSKGDAIATS